MPMLRLEKLVEGLLATAGGFLVGYVLVAILGWLFDKRVIKRQSPEFLHRVCRLIGGITLAFLVAMYVFGGGGGDGGGIGEGTGNNKASPVNGTLDPKTPNADLLANATKSPGLAPEERLRITMLGGNDVKDMKFYLVEDDPTPRTLDEVKAAVLKRKESTMKSLGLEVRFTAQNTLAQDHPAVGRLTKWARESAGLSVSFPAEMP
jgi:hypothetical protein